MNRLNTAKSQERNILLVLDSLLKVLIEKNKRYGNSALEPLSVFSKGEGLSKKELALKSICIRVDDKLNRIRNSNDFRKNDIFDLMGYLTLFCVNKGWTNFDDLID